MSPEQFLDHLQQQQLLDPNDIARLREQVSRSSTPVSAKALAKLLVDKGRLTSFQADKILASKPAAAPSPQSEPLGLAPIDDDLGLAPMDDAPAAPSPK